CRIRRESRSCLEADSLEQHRVCLVPTGMASPTGRQVSRHPPSLPPATAGRRLCASPRRKRCSTASSDPPSCHPSSGLLTFLVAIYSIQQFPGLAVSLGQPVLPAPRILQRAPGPLPGFLVTTGGGKQRRRIEGDPGFGPPAPPVGVPELFNGQI